jgi:hypothetical protein
MKQQKRIETVKKARIYIPPELQLNGQELSDLVFVPYDPKIGEIYTLREQGQIIYQLTPQGVTQ